MNMVTSSSKASLCPPRFTPIQECEREGKEDEEFQERTSFGATPSVCMNKTEITPHRQSETRGKAPARRLPESDATAAGDDRGVSCNKCRPTNREKISVVPPNTNGIRKPSISSPQILFKSILTLMTKSPRSSDLSPAPTREDRWKIAVADLSHKVIQATRKRDEALLEVSRLKYAMAELEEKLNNLELYCQNLNSSLENRTNNSSNPNNTPINRHQIEIGDDGKVIQHFLVSISEARASIRILSRSLALQLKKMGNKVYDRISLLLQPYDIKISLSRNPRSLLFYFEALLNRAFFEDFESIGFQKSSSNQILNPIDRCEANFESFDKLKGLTWDEVLNRGTKHFSEEFSRFCDRKMSEIVALLGWNQAWPEPLLQAFFGASKGVWLVHLLANSVHPSLTIFRVDKGELFDYVYMEDMGGDKAWKLVPAMVRIMVTPGFYVYGNVVKCKVLCRYQNNNGIDNDNSDKGLIPLRN